MIKRQRYIKIQAIASKQTDNENKEDNRKIL